MMGKAKRIITDQLVKPEKLSRAKELRREMTPQERTLWECLRANRLAGLHFRRQQVIDGFIVDFYCHQVGVVLELDGSVHSKQVEYDQSRADWLQARGQRVLRFTNDEIEADLDGILSRIRDACSSTEVGATSDE